MRVVLACALALVVLALPAQGATDAEGRTQTIRLVSITTQFEVVVDRPPKNEVGKGDVLWARSTLRNAAPQFGRPKGAIVGSDVGTFTVVSQTRGDVKTTAKLPGGTIRSAGRIGQERLQRVRVTGGTGAYAGARGTLEVGPLGPNPARASNVYRLQLP